MRTLSSYKCRRAFRPIRPGIQDSEIMPATLAPELLTDLLRESMGFTLVVGVEPTYTR